MVCTAFLRVYQPVESFSSEDAERWLSESVDAREAQAGRAWLVTGRLPGAGEGFSITEGAFVRRIEDKVFICPWRTRLRMLVGLLTFRGTVPEEVADAFVDEDVARRAAKELADISDNHPDVRSHILHANWHVPLRWFAAFDPAERILTEDRDGLRIRYETTLMAARERLDRAVDILDMSWLDDSVATALRELMEWISDFPAEGLLELDYGSVAAMFEDEDLVEDRSADEVWACLEALDAGDAARAGRTFGTLSDRWATARAHEAMN